MNAKFILDKAGFPMIWVDKPLSAYIHWLPVTKIQFELFMCDSPSSDLSDAWYREVLSLNPRVSPKNVTKKMVLKTVVNRIQSDIKNGNSFYYFTVNGMTNIFIGSSQISNEMPVTMAGDSIQISFDNDTSGLIDISAFNNMSMGKK